MNSIIKVFDQTEWRPQYYGIQDPLVFEKLKSDFEKVRLDNVFTSDLMLHAFPENINLINSFFHFTCFHRVHGQIMPLKSGFSEDISQAIYDGYSITYSLLQIAVYMGFKEIYLVGADCHYQSDLSKHHFVESGFYDKQAATVGERMIYAFKVAQSFCDSKGIKIYNSTRGGMLEVFERVSLDKLDLK
jgi:hypothetical protein